MNWINQDLIVVLIGYVKGMITLVQMKEWLAENIWDISESASPLDRMILGELELALAEYDRGDRDEIHVQTRVVLLLQLPNPDLAPILNQSLPMAPVA